MKRLLIALVICLLTAHVAHAQVDLHGIYTTGPLEEIVPYSGRQVNTESGPMLLHFDTATNNILGSWEFSNRLGLCELQVRGTFDPPTVANSQRDAATYTVQFERVNNIVFTQCCIPASFLLTYIQQVSQIGVVLSVTQEIVSSAPAVEWDMMHLDFQNVGGWQGCQDPNANYFQSHLDIQMQGDCRAPDPSGLCAKAFTFSGDCFTSIYCGRMVLY